MGIFYCTYSATFLWLRRTQTLIHKLTQKHSSTIPFHIYIHDQDLQQAFSTLTSGANMYVPMIWPNGYILLHSVTFVWLTRTLMNSKTWFYHPFPPLIHDQNLQQAFGSLISGVNTYVPPIWRNGYILQMSIDQLT